MSQRMDDTLIQAYARLNVYETILTAMMTSWLTLLSEEEADALVASLRPCQSRHAASDPAVSDDDLWRILRDTETLLDHFLDRASHQAADVRARSDRDH